MLFQFSVTQVGWFIYPSSHRGCCD